MGTVVIGGVVNPEDKVSLTISVFFSLLQAPMLENKLENDWGNMCGGHLTKIRLELNCKQLEPAYPAQTEIR